MNRGLRVLLTLAILAVGVSGCASFRAARFYQSGTRALDAGEPDLAIAELTRAAALFPTGSEIQNHLGLAYAAAGREDEAREAFQRALALDCGNAAARQNLASFRGEVAREKP